MSTTPPVQGFPANPVIRHVLPDDIAAITAIYGDAVRHGTASFETEAPSVSEMAARLDRLAAGGFPYLVAQAHDGILGYAYAGPYRLRPAYRWTVENSVYVRADTKGRGIGRALLAALIAHAEQSGFRQMVAVIGDSGNAASIGLHASLGFRHIGTFESVGYKHGRWLDSVLMQRALGSGDRQAPQFQEG